MTTKCLKAGYTIKLLQCSGYAFCCACTDWRCERVDLFLRSYWAPIHAISCIWSSSAFPCKQKGSMSQSLFFCLWSIKSTALFSHCPLFCLSTLHALLTQQTLYSFTALYCWTWAPQKFDCLVHSLPQDNKLNFSCSALWSLQHIDWNTEWI